MVMVMVMVIVMIVMIVVVVGIMVTKMMNKVLVKICCSSCNIFSLIKHLKHLHVKFQLLPGHLLLHLPDEGESDIHSTGYMGMLFRYSCGFGSVLVLVCKELLT